jgi:hypothetical protein
MARSDSDHIMVDPEEASERVAKDLQDENAEVQIKVVVDQDHPFDLEGYISQYSGNRFHL